MDGDQVAAPGRRLVFKDEVLERLGISHVTLDRWVRDGRLPAHRVVGNRVAWTDREVEELIDGLPRGWPRGRGRPRKGGG